MKKTIGLMALMMTAVAAFAQPAAARDRDDYNRRSVVVVRHDDRRFERRPVRYAPVYRRDCR